MENKLGIQAVATSNASQVLCIHVLIQAPRSICSNYKDVRRNTNGEEFPQSLGKKCFGPVQEAWLVSYSLHCHSAMAFRALYKQHWMGSVNNWLLCVFLFALKVRF